ncbi:hypothetical protein JHK85_005646 [Glycine max]|nr:hypothetical protein JHK85_005646 [Glycine max]
MPNVMAFIVFSLTAKSIKVHTTSLCVRRFKNAVVFTLPLQKTRSFCSATVINSFTMSIRDSESLNWHYDTELDDETLEIRGRKLFFVIVLFSIILLFTALFVFARRICRHHHGLLLPNAVPPRHASLSPPQNSGLDAEAIKRLPIVLHPRRNLAAAEETECCICLGVFADGEKLKVLPGCDHSFHCECVDKWLANHSNCPLCRASLKLDSSFPRILIQSPPVRTSLLV